MVVQKSMAGLTEVITVHILNGSILLYVKHYTFLQISLIVLELQTAKPEEWLLWATLIFTIVKTLHSLFELAGIIKNPILKFHLKFKNVYEKLVKKFIRRFKQQDKQ